MGEAGGRALCAAPPPGALRQKSDTASRRHRAQAYRFTLLPAWQQYKERYRRIMWPDDDLVVRGGAGESVCEPIAASAWRLARLLPAMPACTQAATLPQQAPACLPARSAAHRCRWTLVPSTASLLCCKHMTCCTRSPACATPPGALRDALPCLPAHALAGSADCRPAGDPGRALRPSPRPHAQVGHPLGGAQAGARQHPALHECGLPLLACVAWPGWEAAVGLRRPLDALARVRLLRPAPAAFVEIMAPAFQMAFFDGFIRPTLYNAHYGAR